MNGIAVQCLTWQHCNSDVKSRLQVCVVSSVEVGHPIGQCRALHVHHHTNAESGPIQRNGVFGRHKRKCHGVVLEVELIQFLLGHSVLAYHIGVVLECTAERAPSLEVGDDF